MELFENFTVSVLKLNKLVHKIKQYEMSGYGLKVIHVMCVYYLSRHGALSAGEICKLTLEDKAAVSRALNLLKEKGYISYDSNKHNATAALTESGKEVADFIDERAKRAVEAGKAAFTEESRVAFYKALGTISDNLEAYYERLSKGEEE